MNNATIIREYHDRPVFREYYSLNKNLVPNWVGHLVLAGLMYLMPALVAEKMLLSGYVILLPISLCYVLRTIRPDGAFLTVLIFPFVYNFLLHMGFYNFSDSLVMFFFVVGYWLKHYEGFTRRDMMMLTVLSLVLYFCHIVSLMTAYMAIGLLTPNTTLLPLHFSPHGYAPDGHILSSRVAPFMNASGIWRHSEVSLTSKTMKPF